MGPTRRAGVLGGRRHEGGALRLRQRPRSDQRHRPLGAPDSRDVRDRHRRHRDLDALLDAHGTTLRDEPGIGPIAAATLLAEVGDPHRFSRESKFARWWGTGAVALSSGEGHGLPVRHRLDFGGNRRINRVLYIASVTQQRDIDDAHVYIDRKIAEGQDPTRRPTSPQTPPRQPSDPPHVERRTTTPRGTTSTRCLTMERLTDPRPSTRPMR